MAEGQTDIVSQFVTRINSGDITFDRVRQELTSQGKEEEEIRTIVRQVDDELQRQLVSGSGRMRDVLFRAGMVLAVAGLLLTMASLTGTINLRGFGLFFAYGPLLFGISLMIAARRNRQKPKKL